MSKYHINVFFSADDGCWVADVPDLKFCSAFGDTAVLVASGEWEGASA